MKQAVRKRNTSFVHQNYAIKQSVLFVVVGCSFRSIASLVSRLELPNKHHTPNAVQYLRMLYTASLFH